MGMYGATGGVMKGIASKGLSGHVGYFMRYDIMSTRYVIIGVEHAIGIYLREEI